MRLIALTYEDLLQYDEYKVDEALHNLVQGKEVQEMINKWRTGFNTGENDWLR